MIPDNGRCEGHQNKEGRDGIQHSILFGEELNTYGLNHHRERGDQEQNFGCQRNNACLRDLNSQEGIEKTKEGVKRCIVKICVGDLREQKGIINILVIW